MANGFGLLQSDLLQEAEQKSLSFDNSLNATHKKKQDLFSENEINRSKLRDLEQKLANQAQDLISLKKDLAQSRKENAELKDKVSLNFELKNHCN